MGMLDHLSYLAVEGPIGVGKSSLVRSLSLQLQARPILEAVAENPFLDHYYADMRKYAFQTQVFFLISRYKQQQLISQRDLFHRLTISDYLFDKDEIFARLSLTEEELQLYLHLQPLLASRIPRPDLVLLLQADVDTLMARIRGRGKRSESKMPREYVERVVEAYERYFFEYDAAPVLVVNTKEVDFVHNPDDLEELIRQMERSRSGRQYYVPRPR